MPETDKDNFCKERVDINNGAWENKTEDEVFADLKKAVREFMEADPVEEPDTILLDPGSNGHRIAVMWFLRRKKRAKRLVLWRKIERVFPGKILFRMSKLWRNGKSRQPTE